MTKLYNEACNAEAATNVVLEIGRKNSMGLPSEGVKIDVVKKDLEDLGARN